MTPNTPGTTAETPFPREGGRGTLCPAHGRSREEARQPRCRRKPGASRRPAREGRTEVAPSHEIGEERVSCARAVENCIRSAAVLVAERADAGGRSQARAAVKTRWSRSEIGRPLLGAGRGRRLAVHTYGRRRGPETPLMRTAPSVGGAAQCDCSGSLSREGQDGRSSRREEAYRVGHELLRASWPVALSC
jgi:hypothetical protein